MCLLIGNKPPKYTKAKYHHIAQTSRIKYTQPDTLDFPTNIYSSPFYKKKLLFYFYIIYYHFKYTASFNLYTQRHISASKSKTLITSISLYQDIKSKSPPTISSYQTVFTTYLSDTFKTEFLQIPLMNSTTMNS